MVFDVQNIPVTGFPSQVFYVSLHLAAKARHIHITPVIEVVSLALAIAMVRSSSLATVLPASSFRKVVNAGTLIAVSIDREEIHGALSIILSADRSLSEAERIILQELIYGVKNGENRN